MNSKEAELIQKYRIDIEKLKDEQVRLAKTLSLKDSRDFSSVEMAGGVDSGFEGNKIISTISVMGSDLELLYQEYAIKKLSFPYITGFRAYRELPAMVEAFNKLDEKPDVVFVKGEGTVHPRLGIASHFSLAVGVPTIGVAESLTEAEIKGEDIILNGKIVGRVLVGKEGSKPLYISPGNLISLKSAFELTKKFIQYPHKLPEPLYVAGKYGKKMKKEILVMN